MMTIINAVDLHQHNVGITMLDYHINYINTGNSGIIMTRQQIDALACNMEKKTGQSVSVIETHISWVVLQGAFAFKIKKPMQYSFLDYSTLEKRRYCCYKELILNRRVAREMYLAVVPVCLKNGLFHLQRGDGLIVDYAVKMKRLDEDKLMIRLLGKKAVTGDQITTLSKKIARFHHGANMIVDTFAWRSFDKKFADLAGVQSVIATYLDEKYRLTVNNALKNSTVFLRSNAHLLNTRVRHGFQRDVHGDLHAKNIFLYDDPVIFDCIEFNDDYRQMDVLNELAFCCMDLEANDRSDFSRLLLREYRQHLPAMRNDAERKLFIYYKAYRANIRAKVNALRAMQERCSNLLKKHISGMEKYLKLMDMYMEEL